MRWLAVALLLANFVFFGWNWQTSQRMPEVAVPASEGPPLRLLSEASKAPIEQSPAPDRPALAAEAGEGKREDIPGKPDGTAVGGQVCYRVGNLDDAGSRDALAARLEKLGATITGRGSEQGSVPRQWVYLPPFPDSKAAGKVIKRLESRGFRDYYLVKSGENMNAISLGVFSEPKGAERRVRQVRRYGFEPRTETVAYPAKRHWLELRWAAEGPFPPAGAIQANADVASVPCPRGPAG